MSEQATFIRSLPPVVGRTTTETPPTAEVEGPTPVAEVEAPVAVTEGTVVADAEISIQPFQSLTYTSILISLCVFGFAAVLTFQRGLNRSKLLKPVYFGFGAVLVALTLHGFVTSRIFASYLHQEVAEASLFYRLGVWIIFAPALAWLRCSLFGMRTGKDSINQMIDSVLFGAVLLTAGLALMTGISQTAGIMLAILSLFIYVVIVARSFGIKKAAEERNPALRTGPPQLVWSALIYGPVIFPLLALANVFGLGHDLVHFSLTIGEILIVGVAVVGLVLITSETDRDAEAVATEGAPAAPAKEAVLDPFNDPSFGIKDDDGRSRSASVAGAQASESAQKRVSGKPIVTPSASSASVSGRRSVSVSSGPRKAEPAKPEPQKPDAMPKPPPKPPLGSSQAVKPPPKPKRRF